VYNNVQVYAYTAYQFYAREGNVDLYLNKLKNLTEREYRNYQTARVKRGELKATKTKEDIEAEVYRKHSGEINDIMAVERAVERIEKNKKGKLIMDILLYTVFADVLNIGPRLEVYKSTESIKAGTRVYEAMENLHISHATVYYWLDYAYKLFAEERGLRYQEFPHLSRKYKKDKKKLTQGSKPIEEME